MSCGTDVLAAYVGATGTAVAFGTRVRGVHLTGGGTAGAIELRDGGAGGGLRMRIDIPINGIRDVLVPEEGVLFRTDVHATLTGGATATIFYG